MRHRTVHHSWVGSPELTAALEVAADEDARILVNHDEGWLHHEWPEAVAVRSMLGDLTNPEPRTAFVDRLKLVQQILRESAGPEGGGRSPSISVAGASIRRNWSPRSRSASPDAPDKVRAVVSASCPAVVAEIIDELWLPVEQSPRPSPARRRAFRRRTRTRRPTRRTCRGRARVAARLQLRVPGSPPVSFGGSCTVEHDGTRRPEDLDRASVLLCSGCGQATVVVEEKWIGDHPARGGIAGGGLVTYRGIHSVAAPELGGPRRVDPDRTARQLRRGHASGGRPGVARSRRHAAPHGRGPRPGSRQRRGAEGARPGTWPPPCASWPTTRRSTPTSPMGQGRPAAHCATSALTSIRSTTLTRLRPTHSPASRGSCSTTCMSYQPSSAGPAKCVVRTLGDVCKDRRLRRRNRGPREFPSSGPQEHQSACCGGGARRPPDPDLKTG